MYDNKGKLMRKLVLETLSVEARDNGDTSVLQFKRIANANFGYKCNRNAWIHALE